MAEIRPFKGLRFNTGVAGDLATLTTPPYDVIDQSAQAGFYERSPFNIIRVELGKALPNDSAENNRYTRASGFLRQWIHDGALASERQPALYVYQHRFGSGDRRLTRIGFYAALRLEEWAKRIVRPHELTMAGPKQDRLQLMRATSVNCSPIFVLYSDPRLEARAALATIVDTLPAAFLESDGEEHRLWAVTDRGVLAVLAKVIAKEPVYIADGHHRYETALHYRNERRAADSRYGGDEAWNYVMSLMVDVDDPGLVVLPTHRLVNPRVEDGELRTRLENCCLLERTSSERGAGGLDALLKELERAPAERHVFGTYGAIGAAGNQAFALMEPRAVPRNEAVAANLDVSVLLDVVLRGACQLEAEDSEDETRLTYTRDAEAALRAVRDGRYKLAFFLRPTPVKQVLEVADAGEVMPHKSTYFHPKPLTGLVVSRLDEKLT